MNILRVEEEYLNEDSSNGEDYQDSGTQSFNFHYVCIKDLSRLVSTQLSAKKTRKYICDRCLYCFSSEGKLMTNSEYCKRLNHYKTVLPKPEKNIVEFKNFKCREKVPFIIYVDSESLLKPVEDQEITSNTDVFQKHEVCEIGYYLMCSSYESLPFCKSCPKDMEPTK